MGWQDWSDHQWDTWQQYDERKRREAEWQDSASQAAGSSCSGGNAHPQRVILKPFMEVPEPPPSTTKSPPTGRCSEQAKAMHVSSHTGY
eukprot:1979901-Karenia_brevis.AAC.1